MNTERKKRSKPLMWAISGLIALGTLFAHPMVEGGMKTGFVWIKGFAGTHVEFVADPGANELRLYVSEAEDGTLPDGKKWEWVINMAVRAKEITTADGRKETVSLLPLRDPGSAGQWFPVAPVEAKDGYVFYRSEVTARVMLDADAAKRHEVTLKAGKDPNGRHCYKAPLELSQAKTIRVEEVKFAVIDAAGKKEPWTKVCFEKAYGLGLLKMKKADKIPEVDMPLEVYRDAISKIPEADQFRKPEAPVS